MAIEGGKIMKALKIFNTASVLALIGWSIYTVIDGNFYFNGEKIMYVVLALAIINAIVWLGATIVFYGKRSKEKTKTVAAHIELYSAGALILFELSSYVTGLDILILDILIVLAFFLICLAFPILALYSLVAISYYIKDGKTLRLKSVNTIVSCGLSAFCGVCFLAGLLAVDFSPITIIGPSVLLSTWSLQWMTVDDEKAVDDGDDEYKISL